MAGGCVAKQHSQDYDTTPSALRHSAGALRHTRQVCDTTSGKGLGCDTDFVSSPGGGLRYAQLMRATWPRYSRPQARHAYDMAGGGPLYKATARHNTVECAQPGHTMRAARVRWVCTNALFQSLFRTLFMNTVHEHYSQKKIKNK